MQIALVVVALILNMVVIRVLLRRRLRQRQRKMQDDLKFRFDRMNQALDAMRQSHREAFTAKFIVPLRAVAASEARRVRDEAGRRLSKAGQKLSRAGARLSGARLCTAPDAVARVQASYEQCSEGFRLALASLTSAETELTKSEAAEREARGKFINACQNFVHKAELARRHYEALAGDLAILRNVAKSPDLPALAQDWSRAQEAASLAGPEIDHNLAAACRFSADARP